MKPRVDIYGGPGFLERPLLGWQAAHDESRAVRPVLKIPNCSPIFDNVEFQKQVMN